MPGVSPAGLQEAIENPEVFSEMARADLYILFARLRVLMSNPAAKIGDQLKWADMLTRVARLPRDAIDEGPREERPSIEIVFNNAPEHSIRATPVLIDDAAV